MVWGGDAAGTVPLVTPVHPRHGDGTYLIKEKGTDLPLEKVRSLENKKTKKTCTQMTGPIWGQLFPFSWPELFNTFP